MTPSRITLADVSPDPDLYMMSPWRPTTPSDRSSTQGADLEDDASDQDSWPPLENYLSFTPPLNRSHPSYATVLSSPPGRYADSPTRSSVRDGMDVEGMLTESTALFSQVTARGQKSVERGAEHVRDSTGRQGSSQPLSFAPLSHTPFEPPSHAGTPKRMFRELSPPISPPPAARSPPHKKMYVPAQPVAGSSRGARGSAGSRPKQSTVPLNAPKPRGASRTQGGAGRWPKGGTNLDRT
ncbi:hypothetical protein HYDPIDRAFT_34925 [Hydnomerulius pinastri MD-312]|uniref:Uncharacterized protein n=1 Tax=Hydnomerulius pinastri MD-312 TaxID=994086 RepID=A0A0C9VWN5_9AGAM|nr:hypothetical protein HYDPIDRAFT_34925 [Hydnomerulius pinastri MD-312]